MVSVAEQEQGILSPYLGHAGASTCVRATALSLGKTSDDMTIEDIPALAENVRRSLSLVLSTALVDSIVERLQRVG